MGRAFGVAAGLNLEVAAPLAASCAELGYDSIWSNDHPGAKGLETLAVFAEAAPRIDLGVAVIALDRTPP
jgi:alkanesulfonate monooxygenase SsuD/methylene tetrahydromethanopterin reductase-like flavin-dependent oxidoreductase (luciferase family)